MLNNHVLVDVNYANYKKRTIKLSRDEKIGNFKSDGRLTTSSYDLFQEKKSNRIKIIIVEIEV